MPIYLSSPKMSVAMMLLRADIIIEFDGGEDRKFQLRAVQVPQFRSAVFIYMCVCVCVHRVIVLGRGISGPTLRNH